MHSVFSLSRLAFACISFAILTSLASAQFSVSGRQILKDGAAFTVKGVCYNPTPIGDNGFTRAPNGDYFTSKYAAIQDRDLPLLREMGANVVRIYGWAPTADHTGFLNKCYNNGDRPIYVLVNYWIDPATDWNNTRSVQTIIDQYVNIETRLGSHPAVLGVILGNEVNQYYGNGGKPAFWAAMQKIAAAVKAKNPSRLVSIAITDAIDHVSNGNATLTSIDFWCMQIYRYPSFGSLFNDYAARSSRPLVISEYGFDAWNNAGNAPWPDNAAFPGQVVSSRWQEISAASAVCSGGCVFEWSDEFFKVTSGSDTAQEPGGFYTQFPDGVADEEWWGLFSVRKGSTTDILTPREAFYQLAALWRAPIVTPPPPPPPTGLDTSFESISVGSPGAFSSFKYNPSLANYAFAGNSGIAANGCGFTSGNTNAPEGSQVGFVQSTGSISLTVPLTAGTYQLKAQIANRANWGGQQTVTVYLDGQSIGSWSAGTSYTLATSNAFTVPDGTRTITFAGQSSADATLFVDQISIQAASQSVTVTVGSSSFEAPFVGTNLFNAFQYTPAVIAGTQQWAFSGHAGVAGNVSGFTEGNANAPAGTQVAFVQYNTSSISQTLNFPSSGNYTLTVKAALRGRWNAGSQTVQVTVDGAVVGSFTPASTSYQTFTIPFTASQGDHQIAFKGTSTADATALIDDVVIKGN